MRWAFWQRRNADDFSAEVETHLAMEAERLVRGGMRPDEAAHAARRAFGNATTARERFHDAQCAWRSARRSRRYSP
jgi:hypothetical protein